MNQRGQQSSQSKGTDMIESIAKFTALTPRRRSIKSNQSEKKHDREREVSSTIRRWHDIILPSSVSLGRQNKRFPPSSQE